jgi:hypothetical protein
MRKTAVRKLRKVHKTKYAGYTWRSLKKAYNKIPRPRRNKALRST